MHGGVGEARPSELIAWGACLMYFSGAFVVWMADSSWSQITVLREPSIYIANANFWWLPRTGANDSNVVANLGFSLSYLGGLLIGCVVLRLLLFAKIDLAIFGQGAIRRYTKAVFFMVLFLGTATIFITDQIGGRFIVIFSSTFNFAIFDLFIAGTPVAFALSCAVARAVMLSFASSR